MGAGAGDAGRNSPASPERRRCAAAGAGAGADGWNSPASPERAAGAGAAAGRCRIRTGASARQI